MNILQRQSYNTYLNAIGNLAVTDGNFIVGNGTTWVAESGNTARTSLGLGTGDSPTFTGLTINGASGNTLVVDTNTLVVDATNGRVGIGTTGPSKQLHIYKSSGDSELQIETNSAGRALLSLNGVKTSDASFAGIWFSNAGDSIANISALRTGSNTDGALTFGTQNAAQGLLERVRIDSSGLVGINKTSPGAQLHVVSSAASTHIAVFEAAATPSANLIEVNSNGATGGDIAKIDQDGFFVQQQQVIRAFIVKTGISDNVATGVFRIATTNESGSTDGGGYSCKVHAVTGHNLANNQNPVVARSFTAHFAHAIQSTGSTPTNSAISEISESASAATGAATRQIDNITMTASSSGYNTDVSFTIDLSGTSIGTAQVAVLIEVVWHGFLTQPSISAL